MGTFLQIRQAGLGEGEGESEEMEITLTASFLLPSTHKDVWCKPKSEHKDEERGENLTSKCASSSCESPTKDESFVAVFFLLTVFFFFGGTLVDFGAAVLGPLRQNTFVFSWMEANLKPRKLLSGLDSYW